MYLSGLCDTTLPVDPDMVPVNDIYFYNHTIFIFVPFVTLKKIYIVKIIGVCD